MVHRDDARHFLRFSLIATFLIAALAILGMVALIVEKPSVMQAEAAPSKIQVSCGKTLGDELVIKVQGDAEPAFIETEKNRYFEDSIVPGFGHLAEIKGTCDSAERNLAGKAYIWSD